MKNNGNAESVIQTVAWTLKHLARHTNLLDPEQVKHYIANATIANTTTPISNSTKNKRVFCYDKFCQYNNIEWTKPKYRVEPKVPLIPTQANVEAIINCSSRNYATIFTLLAEIGCSPTELHNTTHKDIDLDKGVVSIRGTKGHASGKYKLKKATLEMVRKYLLTHPCMHAVFEVTKLTRTIKVSEENSRRLWSLAGKLQQEKGVKQSPDDAISYLLNNQREKDNR